MRLICILIICLHQLQASKGTADGSNESCPVSRQMDEECGEYAYTIVKPMMSYFDQVTQKIDLNNAEMEGKNNRIRQLEDKEIKLQLEASQLRLEIASKDKFIKLLEDKDESTADHIKSLKQEIQLLTKVFEIEPEAKNLKQQLQREIVELNAKVSLSEEKVIKCKAELDNQKEINHTNEQRFHQMQVEVKKSADMSKEIEKKNSKGCIARDSTGVHNVTMDNGLTFKVLCNADIAGPGWTVIQQRINGRIDFYRNWVTYRDGFGDFWDGDFFIGLEKIHQLTNQQPHELYIHMTYFIGSTIFARYDDFAISGEDDQYRLNKLGKFIGSDGLVDMFSPHFNMKFSTYDRDNDISKIKNCAEYYNNGWWNNHCYDSNLNGVYFNSEVEEHKSLHWKKEKSLKHVKMMIRPKAVSK